MDQPEAMAEKAAAKVISAITRPEDWPVPSWLDQGGGGEGRKFEGYWRNFLRERYLDLEARYLSAVQRGGAGLDRAAAGRVAELLRSARERLENRSSELSEVHSRMDLIHRQIAGLLTLEDARAQALALAPRLQAMPGGDALAERLDHLADSGQADDASALRAVLEEGWRLEDDALRADWVAGRLRLVGMRRLIVGSMLGVMLLVALSPVLCKADGLDPWALMLPENVLSRLPKFIPQDFTAWVYSTSIASVGAAGGGLSALQRYRTHRPDPLSHQESVLGMYVKVLVGAFLAVLSFELLSWGLLPGVEIVSAGSYLLIAFLSGFSERYFLQIIRLDKVMEEEGKRKNAGGGAAD